MRFEEVTHMKVSRRLSRRFGFRLGIIAVAAATLVGSIVYVAHAQDKYSAKVPGGLAMSEFGETKDGRRSASVAANGPWR
jgi:hypothetical protein